MLSRRSVKGLGFLEFMLTVFVFAIIMLFLLKYAEGKYKEQDEADKKRAEEAGEKYVPRVRCIKTIYTPNC